MISAWEQSILHRKENAPNDLIDVPPLFQAAKHGRGLAGVDESCSLAPFILAPLYLFDVVLSYAASCRMWRGLQDVLWLASGIATGLADIQRARSCPGRLYPKHVMS